MSLTESVVGTTINSGLKVSEFLYDRKVLSYMDLLKFWIDTVL